MTVFYDWASPPARSVISFCKYAKLPNVSYKEVRLTKNEQKSPEFTRINPKQQVPAILEVDEESKHSFALSESHAIMRYLALTRPGVEPSLYADKEPEQRARIDEYLDWHHVGLRFGTNRFVFLKYFSKLRKLPDPTP